MTKQDKKLTNLLARYNTANDELFALEAACEWPYKAGAMVCVNTRTDTWEQTKTWDKKIDSKNNKISSIDTLICDHLVTKHGRNNDAVCNDLDKHGSCMELFFYDGIQEYIDNK